MEVFRSFGRVFFGDIDILEMLTINIDITTLWFLKK